MSKELDFDAALASGDPDQIEQLLAQYEAQGDQDDTDTEGEQEAVALSEEEDGESLTPEPEAQSEEAEPEAKAEESEQEQDSEPKQKPVVLSKNGKHTIPYEELEAARQEAKLSREEHQKAMSLIEEMSQKSQELEARLSWSEKQMKKNGIDPSDPPEMASITDEQLDALEENYGEEIAGVIRGIHATNQKLMSQLQRQPEAAPQKAQSPSPQAQAVHEAIGRNESLKSWETSDPQRWEQAVRIDEVLKTDPAWKSRTLDERFTEVVRRTQAVFGDTLDDPASRQQQEAQNAPAKASGKQPQVKAKAKTSSIPDSLSEVSAATVEGEKSQAEMLSDMSMEQIQARMDKMTPDQVEKLLESLS